MIQAVIFDMDGVLIDSVHAGRQARQELLAAYGVDLTAVPDPQGEDHRAASLATLLASVQAHYGITIDRDEFKTRAIAHMQQALQGQRADPDLLGFLQDLAAHGIRCAVASSGTREGVHYKLRQLGIADAFEVIVTGDDVEAHKPHPDSYVYAMEKLGLSPEACLVIEDSATGVQAGLAAGCKVVGFVGFHTDQPAPSGTALNIRTWHELHSDMLDLL